MPLDGFGSKQLVQISRAVAREREARKYRTHAGFTQGAWHIIEPGTPFIDNWHLHAISAHLEAVSEGYIKLLIVNIPPRHMKSIGISVTWCPWEWGPRGKPYIRWLYASYAAPLSIRDSLKARRIIQSNWYQRLWGEQVQLAGDQNAKLRFENTATGYRLATSVGGVGTGEGGDRIVVDDPHNVNEAESEPVRKSTVEWWSKSMSTRINNAEIGAHVIVMQRVHERDLSGYELKERAQDFLKKDGEAVHLMLPAEFEKKRQCVTYIRGKEFFRDPRKIEGELLWPARFTPKYLTSLKIRLGTYGTAGQLQQRPSPEGGGIIPVGRIRLWAHDIPLPDFSFVVQSYDTAFTEKTQNDPTAHTTWGVFPYRGLNHVMLLDAWTDYLAYPKLREKALEDWFAVYGGRKGDDLHPPRRANMVLIEEKGSGISLIQDLRNAGVPVAVYNPGHADKIARGHRIGPLLECDVVWVPESKKDPGKPISWARPVVEQGRLFPNTEHDDLVDTMTQALIYLMDIGELRLPEAAEELPASRDYAAAKRARRNPYGG